MHMGKRELASLKYIFLVEIQLFVTLKSDQDQDPGADPSAWICIGWPPWIRIRIDIKRWIRTRIGTDAVMQRCQCQQ
jgi:hypothetical protein